MATESPGNEDLPMLKFQTLALPNASGFEGAGALGLLVLDEQKSSGHLLEMVKLLIKTMRKMLRKSNRLPIDWATVSNTQ